ncbi:YlxM family DNA-binding protein [Anaerorhabdus sp.]|uniref:Uncharacterized protein n=1 Tax=bioreactor metagenome TaxID=1076179 RepID=A0A645DBK9_9ZZZZ|nr:DNA-binding protein [Anaerorhabdus sp.]MEA4875009.1 DNA-binding protein [Anaerorhabdus sp.]
MFNKKELMNYYLDFYEELLTDKQQKICNYYFREDYSITEIAELESISRAGVHDAIKRSELALEDFEKKLNCYESFNKRQEYYKKIKEFNNQEINKIIDQCIDTE